MEGQCLEETADGRAELKKAMAELKKKRAELKEAKAEVKRMRARAGAESAKANKGHKDSLFTYMFGGYSKEWLLEMYNAFAAAPAADASLIEIVTLRNILYMNQANDIAFTVGGRLVVLIEHQSTVSGNLPLRILMYIGRTYEKLLNLSGNRDRVYARETVMIPRPLFIVLYNGKDECPDRMTLSLSDAFAPEPAGAGAGPDEDALGVKVRLYNINRGCNADIVAKSGHLEGYVIFEDEVRRAFDENGGDLDAAIRTALDYCERHGVLADFLPGNASEVKNMLTAQFDVYRMESIWKEEARKEARKEALEEGIEMEKAAVALRMREEGYTAEQISRITGLPPEQLHGPGPEE